MWRLLSFEIHYHWPPIERLPVHLPLMNIIKIKTHTKLTDITTNPKNTKTMLTEWLNTNKKYEEARELTYCEFPEKWLWDEKIKRGRKDNMVSKLEDYTMLTQLKENDFIYVCF